MYWLRDVADLGQGARESDSDAPVSATAPDLDRTGRSGGSSARLVATHPIDRTGRSGGSSARLVSARPIDRTVAQACDSSRSGSAAQPFSAAPPFDRLRAGATEH